MARIFIGDPHYGVFHFSPQLIPVPDSLLSDSHRFSPFLKDRHTMSIHPVRLSSIQFNPVPFPRIYLATWMLGLFGCLLQALEPFFRAENAVYYSERKMVRTSRGSLRVVSPFP